MSSVFDSEITDSKDRGALAKMVMKLMDHWNVSIEDQTALLGITAGDCSTLARYRKGKLTGTSRDQLERVGHLLSIHKNLRMLYPQNRDVAYKWMSTRNRAFDQLSPIQIIKDWGFAGLLMVRSYLAKSRGV